MGVSVSVENLSEQWTPGVSGWNSGMGNWNLCEPSKRATGISGALFEGFGWMHLVDPGLRFALTVACG